MGTEAAATAAGATVGAGGVAGALGEPAEGKLEKSAVKPPTAGLSETGGWLAAREPTGAGPEIPAFRDASKSRRNAATSSWLSFSSGLMTTS